MKTDGGVEVQLHVFLTLTLDENQWLVSHPGDFSTGEKFLDKRLGGP